MRKSRSHGLLAALVLSAVAAAPAVADTQFGFYVGSNSNFSSTTRLAKGNLVDSRDIGWAGKSFKSPYYWGVRITHWLESRPDWGLSLDYTHAKAYAKLNFATDPVYRHLEFTDGNNLLILNALRRFEPRRNGALTPYLGIGLGAAIPHVEVELKAVPGQRTWSYQFTGVAAQAVAGLDYRFNSAWSMNLEAKLSYSQINADLEGGGTLETNLWSPHVLLGINYRIGGD